MGRGRKEAINQSAKKLTKQAMQKQTTFSGWVRRNRILPKKKVVYLPEDERIETDEPHEAANVLINM